jgi:hypothetical protein
MAVRHQPGGRAGTSIGDPQRPVVVLDDPPARAPQVAWRFGLAGLLAVVAGSGAWWMAGADHQVQARPAVEPAASAPVPAVEAPAGLAVSVRAPARVVAGRSARFVVTYSDGEGIFSGGIEDWGDAGVGSVGLSACDASLPAAGRLHTSYVATHTWSDPASYPVSFAVTTYTCRNGRPMQETHDARLTVVVRAH